MRGRLAAAVAVAAAAGVLSTPGSSGCGGDAPAEPPMGGPCEAGAGHPPPTGSCAEGLQCFGDHLGIKGGLCTRPCGPERPCPSGSTCQRAFWDVRLCLPLCDQGRCREGWNCEIAVNICRSQPLPEPREDTPCHPDGPGPDPAARATWSVNVGVPSPPRSVHEAEAHIAVDPRPGSRRVAIAAIADDDATWPFISVAVSDDGGDTWPRNRVTVIDDGKVFRVADPSVAFDRDGRLHVAYLAFRVAGLRTLESKVMVRTSADGTTFAPAIAVAAAPESELEENVTFDRPFLAASAASPAVAIAFSRIDKSAGEGTIRAARSLDGGGTWERPSAVLSGLADPSATGIPNIPVPRFDESDHLRVLWIERFPGDVHVVRLGSLPPAGPPRPDVRVSPAGEPVIFATPAFAAAGATLHAAWAAGDSAGRAWDVHATRSADGGTTWSPPDKVNDDASCATHWLLAGQATADGRFHLVWYDERRGPGLVVHGVHPNPGYAAPNTSVSDCPFPFVTIRRGLAWPGDYLGLALKEGTLYAAWSDARVVRGDPILKAHVYVSRATLP